MAVPDANASWTETAMVKHKHADVGVAVSIPGGLITPIIRKADQKGLAAISNEMKDLAARAKSGKLIELLFNLLLSSQAIEPEGFFAWSEDDAEDSPGRLDAAVQTSGFLMKLRELLQDDEEEEEEEVDRPREIVK
eukprot:gene37266-50302_t